MMILSEKHDNLTIEEASQIMKGRINTIDKYCEPLMLKPNLWEGVIMLFNVINPNFNNTNKFLKKLEVLEKMKFRQHQKHNKVFAIHDTIFSISCSVTSPGLDGKCDLDFDYEQFGCQTKRKYKNVTALAYSHLMRVMDKLSEGVYTIATHDNEYRRIYHSNGITPFFEDLITGKAVPGIIEMSDMGIGKCIVAGNPMTFHYRV
jgi:hypothetical protein